MSHPLTTPYWKRFLIALCSAAVLVFSCSVSLQLHTIREPQWLLLIAAGVLVAAIPGSAISAWAFPRNPLALVLGSQVLTVAALAIWFGLSN